MTFVCEEGPHQVRYPSDQIVVSLDLVTSDGRHRLRRVRLRTMCKEHALAWIGTMDARPTGEQLDLPL